MDDMDLVSGLFSKKILSLEFYQSSKKPGNFSGRGRRHSNLERYITDRVEVLRQLYEKHEPELKKVLTYKHPSDGRCDNYGLFPVDEDKINSPFDLPNLEEYMPNKEDYV